MAGADLRRIGVAHDWDALRLRDIGRAVPALAFGVGVAVNLDYLREAAATWIAIIAAVVYEIVRFVHWARYR